MSFWWQFNCHGDWQDTRELENPPRAKEKREKEIKQDCQNSLVWAVNIINGQDGQVAVVAEVTEGNAGTGLELVLVDDLLGNIEGNGHREDIAIGKAAVLDDTMHIPSALIPITSFICNTYRS